MLAFEKTIWISLTHGIDSVSGIGASVWSDPAMVRKALGEILGVLPVTHGEIDLGAMIGVGESRADSWKAALEGKSEARLREIADAISDAFRPPRVWGISVPAPKRLAALLGGDSDRAALKAGMQLASCLRALRESGVGFLTIDFRGVQYASPDKPSGPVMRNAEMYGWKRALRFDTLDTGLSARADADAVLLGGAAIDELKSSWAGGDAIGGGLTVQFWKGEAAILSLPGRFFLYGEIPEDTPAAAIVEAGRTLGSLT
ncbi:MAG TPA: hypothetical protein VEF03_02585 [Candidatus Binataceae bacterium]|nr:hypothetical protein [Candidatus Binataceae bacterium]